jgi:opacity protein-like surface antigen
VKIQVALFAAAAALVAATPAAANEFRVEARGGLTFGENQSNEAMVGAAAGYDYDISEGAFIGLEGSVDKVLVDGSGVVLGGTARLGMKEGNAKFFVDGGYSYLTCDFCTDAVHVGLGVEQPLSGNVYGKVGYRHFFFEGTDSNVVAAGVGMRF